MRSHRTIITIPIAKKFDAPMFLRKSEKCSIASIVKLYQKTSDRKRSADRKNVIDRPNDSQVK
jgi:hypothetical protein